ncbi:MAG: phenylalanine--tRNA ligase subunit alpha [Elusimicrobia bacterium RIFOXYA2_FULL_50_26]|nr:MAG: phenylalanine--tRNA ligase subunit alpha [Elusimicrobia bacterium RIFOXYA2_FULL_50_26]
MLETLIEIGRQARHSIEEAGDIETLEKVRVTVLGRKGHLTEILRGLAGLPIEQRKSTGEQANVLREELERMIADKTATLKRKSIGEKLAADRIDTTLPGFPFSRGRFHPLRQTLEEISSIFVSLGFSVAEGPELETDWYNFEALNIPPDHPARDNQDTFYLAGDKRLLRTHTSPVQVHVMEKQNPPLKVIVPGRVFRNEATDATHSAIFHQVEGLAVDERITFSYLKGILTLFVHRFFGANVDLRFRPSHFQFTEPSAEVDIQCTICKGAGCRICKGTGWLEMLGCGMVHPNVFKAVNYDPEKYTGFAFGIGVERFAMFKYGVDDIRLFYENNLKFLEQF